MGGAWPTWSSLVPASLASKQARWLKRRVEIYIQYSHANLLTNLFEKRRVEITKVELDSCLRKSWGLGLMQVANLGFFFTGPDGNLRE